MAAWQHLCKFCIDGQFSQLAVEVSVRVSHLGDSSGVEAKDAPLAVPEVIILRERPICHINLIYAKL